MTNTLKGGRVPVTARLSKAFYDRFGDEATNELVNWLNAVGESYRADLRELNELNFARFDAKVGERLAELHAKWTGRWNGLDAKLEQRIADVRAEIKAGLAEVRAEMSKGFEKLGSGLLKWMFGFWASVVLALVLLAFRMS